MDVSKELNEILKDLQKLNIPATYGNLKLLTGCVERLAALAEAVKGSDSKEAALDG